MSSACFQCQPTPRYSDETRSKTLQDSFGATWHSVNLRLASADSKVPMSTPRAEAFTASITSPEFPHPSS